MNTKAEVRFHVQSADWLPQRVRDRLLSMVDSTRESYGAGSQCVCVCVCVCGQFRSRVTKEGELIVVSQEHRSQGRNLDTAVARLEAMVREASEIPRGPSELTLSRIRAL